MKLVIKNYLLRKGDKKMLKFFSKRKGEKGFTLIELLVVIAIIGILATIVLVSLNAARNKAKDTAIKSALDQARLVAEIYYDDNSSAYTSLSTSVPADMATIATNISSNGGTLVVFSNATDYCAQADLSDASNHCVDNGGFTGAPSAACASDSIGCD